jgi:hypothetical protein
MFGKMGPSMEAKILLPLRTLAYGTAPHSWCDYYQMSQSMARVCCREFNKAIPLLFSSEYLRLPTANDLKAVAGLHKKVHGVDGMFGSLDCMHTYWKNCPVALQSSYKGRQSGPTIVLEAIADYNLWFWHVSYGYSGAMNDLNILNISPLLEKWTEGSFGALERDSTVVPFSVGGESFERMYVLVDGIYPKYSRFVRGLPQPITEEETRFTQWQESARKDIERAFGVLQCKWKVLSYPIHTMNIESIASLMECCLILHNMAVSDRVMGDATERYCPFDGESIPQEEELPVHFEDEQETPRSTMEDVVTRETPSAVTSVKQFEGLLASTVAYRKEWNALKDPTEWGRLQRALMAFKGRPQANDCNKETSSI